MATPQRFLDVWIVESNTVYKEVPYNVVADWLQQGRLLEDDKAKPSGTKDWQRLGDMHDFQPFLLQPEQFRPDDQAEAMEPVGLDFSYKKHHDEEDDDVDMIPLIDVSLVLLVFFMINASTAMITTPVITPKSANASMADDPSSLRIDINIDAEGNIVYSLGVSTEASGPPVYTLAAILDQLRERLNKLPAGGDLVINAHKDLRAKVARDLLTALRNEPFRGKLTTNYYGVTGEQKP